MKQPFDKKLEFEKEQLSPKTINIDTKKKSAKLQKNSSNMPSPTGNKKMDTPKNPLNEMFKTTYGKGSTVN